MLSVKNESGGRGAKRFKVTDTKFQGESWWYMLNDTNDKPHEDGKWFAERELKPARSRK